MNRFTDSIKNDEVKQFLLGEGKYFEFSSEGYDFHDLNKTFEHILEYGNWYGQKKMAKLLQNEIYNLIKNFELSAWEFTQLVNYLYLYVYYKEIYKKIDAEMKVSNKLKDIINEKYIIYIDKFNISDKRNDLIKYQNDLPYLLFNLKKSFDRLKQEYGFSLFKENVID